MVNKTGRRRFGNLRLLASGRYQIRYPGPDGRLRSGQTTYATKPEAERALTMIEASMIKGDWIDPEKVRILLGDYAARWITERPNLRPRTIELYRWTLKRHIDPYLGRVPLGKLTTPVVREWRTTLLDQGVSSGMVAKAYRLLRAVLWTAVNEDGLMTRNPCRIKGADRETPAERPVLNVSQLVALSEVVPARYRAMVMAAALASLRFGEITAMQRQDVDLVGGTIRVERQYFEVKGEGLTLGPPKSRAGVRSLAIPDVLVELLRDHLAEYVDRGPTALVFTVPSGVAIRRGTFNKAIGWRAAVAAIGVPELHFHDLRHTGNVLAASSRVSTRDLMARMGHDSVQAALIYQHKTREADHTIAKWLDSKLTPPDDDGAAGALVGSR